MKIKNPIAVKSGRKIVAIVNNSGEVHAEERKYKVLIEEILKEGIVLSDGKTIKTVRIKNRNSAVIKLSSALEYHGLKVE